MRIRTHTQLLRCTLLLALLLVVVYGFWRPLSRAAAEAATSVSLEPASSTVDMGEEALVTIQVTDVADLYGADVRISFDPALIEVIGSKIEPGTMPYPDFQVKNQVNNSAGTIWYAVTQINPREPVSGSGVMAQFTVRGKAPGTSALTFTNCQLVTRAGVAIPVTVTGGSVIVTNQGVPPTPTPDVRPRLYLPVLTR